MLVSARVVEALASARQEADADSGHLSLVELRESDSTVSCAFLVRCRDKSSKQTACETVEAVKVISPWDVERLLRRKKEEHVRAMVDLAVADNVSADVVESIHERSRTFAAFEGAIGFLAALGRMSPLIHQLEVPPNPTWLNDFARVAFFGVEAPSEAQPPR